VRRRGEERTGIRERNLVQRETVRFEHERCLTSPCISYLRGSTLSGDAHPSSVWTKRNGPHHARTCLVYPALLEVHSVEQVHRAIRLGKEWPQLPAATGGGDPGFPQTLEKLRPPPRHRLKKWPTRFNRAVPESTPYSDEAMENWPIAQAPPRSPVTGKQSNSLYHPPGSNTPVFQTGVQCIARSTLALYSAPPPNLRLAAESSRRIRSLHVQQSQYY